MQHRYSILRYCIGLLLIIGLAVSPTLAQEPGTAPDDAVDKKQITQKSLDDVFATESGNISTSIDGVGTNSSSGTIQVDKPSSGATVRRAFFLAAAGSDRGTDGELDDITLSAGSSSETISPSDYENTVSGVFSGAEIGRVEVTSFVGSVVDPASAGLNDITVEQSDPADVEGSMLVVIFDDPSVSETRSVSLVFGIQDPDGDSFNIGLADPFDDSSQDIEMSLGISFGFQGNGQVSNVDVNGTRMTSSAGGQDDCHDLDTSDSDQECVNGELFTVGGIGDDPANPPPNDPPGGDPTFDDELYTLDEFVDDGDTQIDVFTENPSFDDNVFFAAFTVKGGTAVVGEGITLAPSSATNPVDTDHTVTATVQDDDGNPIEGRDVDFDITSGPNSGLTGSGTTDANGEATFTWSSSTTGTDIVVAETVDSNGDPLVSNEAEKTWTGTMANNDGRIDQVSGGADAECMAVADELGIGPLEGLAKYEAIQEDDEVVDGFFEFNDGNVGFASDPPQASAGSWTSDVPVRAFLLKQARDLYYWDLDPAVTSFDYNSPVDVYSHFTFCVAETDECDTPSLGEDVVDEENRTVSNTIQDDEGVAEFTFTTLENFEVVTDFDEGYSKNNKERDEDGVSWTWEGDGVPPETVSYTLQATEGSQQQQYFLVATDDCEDPNTVNFDPVHNLRPADAKARLAGNSPNPFSGETTIEFTLPEQTHVTVAVYDVMGRKVATLVDDTRRSGAHVVTWDGQSDSGQDLASGVYLMRMQADGKSDTRRVTIVR